MYNMAAHYDCIVVGAGIEGSATAYNLAKQGSTTLLLEQYSLPHTRGSSAGHSRLIRLAYDDEHYINMVNYAYSKWSELEGEATVKLYEQTGLLLISSSKDVSVEGFYRAMSGAGVICNWLTSADLMSRFPMIIVDDEMTAVEDLKAGTIRADKAIAAYQTLFKVHGGVLKDEEAVMYIIPGDVIRVNTSRACYTADNVVLTAGPWTNKLTIPLGLHLPLKVARTTTSYWKHQSSESLKIPAFIFYKGAGGCDVYGFSTPECSKEVKIGLHGGSEVDPDNRDLEGDNSKELEQLKALANQRFPGLQKHASFVESCMYTETPDGHFILDRHPKWENIIIGAGFSGHGFKFAPAIGEILSSFVTNRKAQFDLSLFNISRF